MHREYIVNMADDLEALAELLTNEGIETSQIYTVSGQLKQKQAMQYKLLPFKIDIKDDEKFPKRLSHQKSAINLELFFDLDISCNAENFLAKKDPFSKYSFNIIVKGKNKNNSNSNLIYAIHFDRHDIAQASHQAHPVYHFQFGGNRLNEDEDRSATNLSHGQALFLDAPRVMHHPLELILGIDFILSNFFPTIWNRIKEIKKYKTMLNKYQKDFVLPYFKSIVEHFESSGSVWNSKEIYPQLV